MNGFEQIKSFYSWVFNNSDKVRPTHISLYIFLLNQNNRSMWVEWFKCPYDLAMQGACIGNKNTYYKCLDELQLFKLIEYKKGINLHKSPLIKLIKLYDNEPQHSNVTVPLSEPQRVPQTEPLSELLNKNTYKLITNNYKLININLKRWIDIELEKSENLIYRQFQHLSISFEDFEKLKTEFLETDILDCFDRIENYKENTKYTSLYLTSKQWLQKQKKDNLSKEKENGKITSKQQYKFNSSDAIKTLTGNN